MLSFLDVKNRYTNATVNILYDQTMDEIEFKSSMFQRPFQYLERFNNRLELRGIKSDNVHGTPAECIEVLLQYVTLLFDLLFILLSVALQIVSKWVVLSM